jgi:hypothetical protein
MTRSVAHGSYEICIPEQLLWPRPHLRDAPESFMPSDHIAGGVPHKSTQIRCDGMLGGIYILCLPLKTTPSVSQSIRLSLNHSVCLLPLPAFPLPFPYLTFFSFRFPRKAVTSEEPAV